MQFVLQHRRPGEIEYGIIYGLIAVIVLGAAFALPVLSFAPGCVFKAATGFPCPTCGATRSVVHIAHGDIGKAFSLNPLVTAIVILVVAYFMASLASVLFRLPRISFVCSQNEGTVIRGLSVAVFCANWLYLIAFL